MKIKINLMCATACWVAVFLSGCATTGGLPPLPSGALANQADLMTASDEPEQRRRARLRLELASGYFQQGQTKIALDEIKQSLATDPGYVDAYNLRGLVYMRLNQMPLAEDSFRRALTISPQDGNVAHNYGWLLCQQTRYSEAVQLFGRAIANPSYAGKAKTLMAQGVCQINAGQLSEAEQSLRHSYEIDAGNPVTGYNLAGLLYKRGDWVRAQFYIRRINNSDLANAETLWLGIKTEYKLNNREAVIQLAGQLRKRFAQSPQLAAYEKGSFDE